MVTVCRKRSLRIMNYTNWKTQLTEDKKVRKYSHIDNSINLDDKISFQKICVILDNIQGHQFIPFLKRFDIKVRYKKDKDGVARRKPKIRPLVYASHVDSHIYSYHNFILEKEYEVFLKENNLSENVIAYRKLKTLENDKGKSNINFAYEVFDEIKKSGDCVVITLDIEQFFDNLSHKILLEKIRTVKGLDTVDKDFYKVFKSLTAYKYILQKEFKDKKIKQKIKNSRKPLYLILKQYVKENRSGKGIPQGSTISGLFANIYLVDFDKEIRITYLTVFYRRYSDDLAFICKPGEETDLLNFINKTINKNRLQINLAKSFVSHFQKDKNGRVSCVKVTNGNDVLQRRIYVDYLGFEFDGEKILLRKNTANKLRRKQIEKVKRQQSNQVHTVRKTSKKITRMLVNKTTNYFKRSMNIISNLALNKQITNVTKARNKVKKSFSRKE
jgi:RNA-directed DNA polymerase